MILHSVRSVTLLELLVAIALLAVVVLAVNNIGVFSHNQFVYSERRAKLQNDVSRCLEHMSKYLAGGIGNESISWEYVAWIGANYLSVYTDTDGDGVRDALGGPDYIVGYKLDPATHELIFCNRCFDSPCSICSGTSEVLANKISAFSAVKNLSSGSNYITVNLTACWDPDGTCNTADNPSINMSSSIALHSVATN